jgi:hypothetical protein
VAIPSSLSKDAYSFPVNSIGHTKKYYYHNKDLKVNELKASRLKIYILVYWQCKIHVPRMEG